MDYLNLEKIMKLLTTSRINKFIFHTPTFEKGQQYIANIIGNLWFK